MSTCSTTVNRVLLALIVLSAVVLLPVAMAMQPVGDDLSYYTAPFAKSLHEHLLPYNAWWRPFDALVGHLLEQHKLWFPWLNHAVVWLFHVLSAATFYAFLRRTSLNSTTRLLATLLLMVHPAIVGTVFDTDSINQTGALLFDLLGLLAYVSLRGFSKYAVWIALTLTATLFKENGITWLVITPLIAMWTDAGQKHIGKAVSTGLLAAAAYGVVRLLLPHYGFHDSIDLDFSIATLAKTTAKIASILLLPIDNVSLIHDRNIPAALLSICLTAPLVLYLLIAGRRNLLDVQPLVALLSLVIVLSPHYFTSFAIMHTYGALPLVVLIMAWLIDHLRPTRLLTALVVLFFSGCLLIDSHAAVEKYRSGQRMERLATEALGVLRSMQSNGEPVDSVYSISLKGSYRGYANICLSPTDAFSWGHAVEYVNHYQWPEEWSDTCIQAASATPSRISTIARQAHHRGYRYVITVGDNGVKEVDG